MVEPFIGSIQYFAFDYAPQGYKICDGSTLSANQNQALYSLINTQFGGDTVNFKIPDMRGRTMIGFGAAKPPITNNYSVGNSGGAEKIPLPLMAHTHTATPVISANNVDAPSSAVALNNFPAKSSTLVNYANSPAANSFLGAPKVIVANAGSDVPIDVRSPYTVLTCCIAIVGLYPQRY